jgi:hypothetical protein
MSVHRARLAVLFCLGVLAAPYPQPAQAGIFDHLLPAWPLTDIGDPIPDGLIHDWTAMGSKCPGKRQFADFPSKGNKDVKALTHSDKYDPGDACDDGEQTVYNGLLCASGEAAGCEAVKAAQDDSGRWHRSPHRRWVWANRCFNKKRPIDGKRNDRMLFNERCTYGFSPDMSLGVLLYTLKTGDTQRYGKWLSWLDRNAAATRLCKWDGEGMHDCVSAEWPRVCTDDLGRLNPGESVGHPIDGRYGGKCALRPWDALDFAVVNQATGTVPPARMRNWEVSARAMIGARADIKPATSGGISGAGGLPANDVPSLIVGSPADQADHPIHLDAVRIVIRMMIRNPSLELNDLPMMLDVDETTAGLPVMPVSDADDPISINAAARLIAARAPSNPFLQLLAEGPSPRVRSMIVASCPAAGELPDRTSWLWDPKPERGDDGTATIDTATIDKRRSMGWDCVFIGRLYNKMRVSKPVVDALVARFQQYAKVLDTLQKRSSLDLQAARATTAATEQALHDAERALDAARDFTGDESAQQRQEARAKADDLAGELRQLNKQRQDMEDRLPRLRSRAAALADTVADKYDQMVCTLDAKGTQCKSVRKTRQIANPEKQTALAEIASLEKQLYELRTGAIVATGVQLAEATQTIADLDSTLRLLHDKLRRKSFEAAISFARADFQTKSAALDEDSRLLSEMRRAATRVKANLCVWKNEARCVH